MNKMYWDDWFSRYAPVCDEQGDLIDYMNDIPDDQAAPNNRVWTELDNGEIYPGRRFVDRFAYYVTEVPWRANDEHSLIVTDLITEADYAAAIAAANADGDEDLVEILLIQMGEEFGDVE